MRKIIGLFIAFGMLGCSSSSDDSPDTDPIDEVIGTNEELVKQVKKVTILSGGATWINEYTYNSDGMVNTIVGTSSLGATVESQYNYNGSSLHQLIRNYSGTLGFRTEVTTFEFNAMGDVIASCTDINYTDIDSGTPNKVKKNQYEYEGSYNTVFREFENQLASAFNCESLIDVYATVEKEFNADGNLEVYDYHGPQETVESYIRYDHFDNHTNPFRHLKPEGYFKTTRDYSHNNILSGKSIRTSDQQLLANIDMTITYDLDNYPTMIIRTTTNVGATEPFITTYEFEYY